MKFLLFIIVAAFGFGAHATEISCEGKDNSGRKATFVIKFGSFPNEPQTLITKIKGKTKRYSIHFCEISYEGSDYFDCRQQPPVTPDLSRITMQVMHEYGLPSDTDELGSILSKAGENLLGFYYDESIDNNIVLETCVVKR